MGTKSDRRHSPLCVETSVQLERPEHRFMSIHRFTTTDLSLMRLIELGVTYEEYIKDDGA